MSCGYKDFASLLARAQHGDPHAQRGLGCAYWWGEDGFWWDDEPRLPKDYHQARYWYTLAAEQGYCQALWDVATMYLVGEGGPADVPRALAYLRRAASRRRWDFGADDAAWLLSHFYKEGHYGIALDADQAAHWEQVEHDLQRKSRGWRRCGGKGSHPRSSG
jgi:TPR repeat protein